MAFYLDMKSFKTIARYIFFFCLTIGVMTGFLVIAAKIPQSAIQAKMKETADYYEHIPQYTSIVPGTRGTQIHNRADETWLSIAYCYDQEHPLESVMWSSYYLSPHKGIHESFLEAVDNEIQAGGNRQYLRYWHGAAGLMRFFHIFMNINQIFAFMAVVFCILLFWLCIILSKRGFLIETACLVISLSMVSIWAVPFCMEYVWVFLCVVVSTIFAGRLVLKRGYEQLGMLFLVTGMITVYLDFLTAETLTLLIPLLLILRISKKSGWAIGNRWLFSVKSGILWGIGYLGTWIMKWVIASAVLGQNVMPLVREHVEERIGGSVSLPITEFLLQAVLKNVMCLLPFDYGIIGAMALFVLIIILLLPIYRGRVRIKKKVERLDMLLYLALGLIPYIRFLILHNHSYIHSFFTYRAQAASILALCFIILELVEPVSAHRKAVKTHGSDHPHVVPE